MTVDGHRGRPPRVLWQSDNRMLDSMPTVLHHMPSGQAQNQLVSRWSPTVQVRQYLYSLPSFEGRPRAGPHERQEM
jgi:hypothetical protein